MKDYQKAKTIVWKIASVIFSLVLFSSYFSAGLAAKYTIQSQATDGARVAKFSYELTGEAVLLSQSLQMELYPGSSQSYEVVLRNTSEVALRCVIKAENTTKNLPIFYDAQLQEYKSYVNEISVPVGKTKTLTFTVEWDDLFSDPAYAGKVDEIVLTISVEQID